MSVQPSRFRSGFTLLELMVVLVLVGIIFTFAVLSFGGDDLAEALERETRRLVTLINMAGDEAVLRGEELAIHFTENGYTFLVLQGDVWRVSADDRLLRAYTLPEGMHVRLEVDAEPPGLTSVEADDEISLTPQVFILSSGEMTPFTASFEADQSRYRYHLIVSLLGEPEWEVEETF